MLLFWMVVHTSPHEAVPSMKIKASIIPILDEQMGSFAMSEIWLPIKHEYLWRFLLLFRARE